MVTEIDLGSRSVEDYRNAINIILSKALIRGGRVDIGALGRLELEYVTQSLQYYRILSGGV